MARPMMGSNSPLGPWTKCGTLAELFAFRFWRGLTRRENQMASALRDVMRSADRLEEHLREIE